MYLTLYERETIINFNEKESTASVFSCNRKLLRQMQELCEKYPELVHSASKSGSGGLTYTIPKKWVRIVPPQVRSEAQKQVLEDVNRRRRERKMEETNVTEKD